MWHFFLWRLRGKICKEGAGSQQVDTTLRELPIVFNLQVGQYHGLFVCPLVLNVYSVQPALTLSID